jgi:hypothetical protein
VASFGVVDFSHHFRKIRLQYIEIDMGKQWAGPKYFVSKLGRGDICEKKSTLVVKVGYLWDLGAKNRKNRS